MQPGYRPGAPGTEAAGAPSRTRYETCAIEARTGHDGSARAGARASGQARGTPHGPRGSSPVASWRAARSQAPGPPEGAGARGGAVSRMKRSSAATTAAACSGEAAGATMRNWGRRFTPERLGMANHPGHVGRRRLRARAGSAKVGRVERVWYIPPRAGLHRPSRGRRAAAHRMWRPIDIALDGDGIVGEDPEARGFEAASEVVCRLRRQRHPRLRRGRARHRSAGGRLHAEPVSRSEGHDGGAGGAWPGDGHRARRIRIDGRGCRRRHHEDGRGQASDS